MVDRHGEDMQVHNTEVVEMMKLASWCLQTNFKRRPSMSSVVKVLEGGMNVESNLDYNFTDPRIQEPAVRDEKDFTALSPSLLSVFINNNLQFEIDYNNGDQLYKTDLYFTAIWEEEGSTRSKPTGRMPVRNGGDRGGYRWPSTGGLEYYATAPSTDSRVFGVDDPNLKDPCSFATGYGSRSDPHVPPVSSSFLSSHGLGPALQIEKCGEQGTLLDMVDRYSEDMQVHNTEVVEMMKLASWCLQTNFKRRAIMLSVVKVLERGMNVESNLDYNFTDPRIQKQQLETRKISHYCHRLFSQVQDK
ncbi:hypothetical protein L1987_10822 [Smallanthus sonchifolius]|uniref:Uncharacterized protein n=1 Tax=Smallanthus sonchifolius TaxID=185202 RepID=A0ACB9J9S0_9ASTR|nr:hypothetical protein L1987_10822 [Smallanthus sonchifolius]